MIYFFINIFLLILIWFFFDKKINQKLSLKKIKFEINDSINLFNRNLEEKLLRVENKIEHFNQQITIIDEKSLELKNLLKSYEKQMKQKKPLHNKEKVNNNNFKKTTLISFAPYKKYEKNTIQKNNGIKKDLAAKIIQLSSRGDDAKSIAQKLAISVDEVKLNLLNRI